MSHVRTMSNAELEVAGKGISELVKEVLADGKREVAMVLTDLIGLIADEMLTRAVGGDPELARKLRPPRRDEN
jgi:hypothetical protein